MSPGWLSCRCVVLKSKLNCYHGNKIQKELSILENKNCWELSFKGFLLNVEGTLLHNLLFIKIKIFLGNVPELSAYITHGPPVFKQIFRIIYIFLKIRAICHLQSYWWKWPQHQVIWRILKALFHYSKAQSHDLNMLQIRLSTFT